MSLFPDAALDDIRAASTAALVDSCAFSVPGGDTVINDDGDEVPGTGVSYAGPCKLNDSTREIALAGGSAEGSPLASSEGWLRLPAVGYGIDAATVAALHAQTSDLSGRVTAQGLTYPFEAVKFETRRTHSRLYVRYTGAAEVTP